MRINRLKISGFKSFVDPITLTLPGNLTGVVGPNGCGKSNIIDALIWVMGESSAKHLRGDSMSDVIFNGSNTRKPVGKATVEIVFDNSDGTIGGQYAGFGEISIKRSISRDAVSSYFLNGARCRRKDVTNVFLGTGLGARGYSVIEQGMISRVIEARPEELRAFLEEAAGISKYKERRRETENRMRHTHENLERLDDIREELDKQLNHLQRQARSAEKYQILKADERRLNAKLLLTRWRALDADNAECQQLIEQRHTELEAEIASLREVEAEQTEQREVQVTATETFNRVQADFYTCSSDITRLEQAIKHAEDRERSQGQDLEQARQQLAELTSSVERDLQQLDTARAQLIELEPDMATKRAEEEQAYVELRAVENNFEQWQHDWDAFNRTHTELAQRDHAAQIRLEHLLADMAGRAARKAVLDDEAGRNDTGDLSTGIAECSQALAQVEQLRDDIVAKRNGVRANLAQNRGATQALGGALHEHQVRLEEQRGRFASLKAVQEQAYGEGQEQTEAWLRENAIDTHRRLAEFVKIEAGWEAALEIALRIPLGALYGQDLVKQVLSAAKRGAQPGGRMTVFDSNDAPAFETPLADSALLATRVSGELDLGPLLAGIYAADDEAEALLLRERLAAHEIVVLKDGRLLGKHWLQVPDQRDVADSILARERQLAELGAQLEVQETESTNLKGQVENAQARLKQMEQDEHEFGEQLETVAREITQLRNDFSGLQAEFQRRQARATDVLAELEQIARQSLENQVIIENLSSERQASETALAQHAVQRESLATRRNTLQGEVDTARQTWRDLRDNAHNIELKLQELRARQETLASASARDGATREQLLARCQQIEGDIAQLAAPREAMALELAQALASKLVADNALGTARRQLSELEASVQRAGAKRAAIAQNIAERQQRLEQVRLDKRALEVRTEELRSRFEQTGEDYDATLAAVQAQDSEASVEAAIERISARIARLGPINLAAIDEFNQLSERKTYLDSQHADLSEALNTLKEAIRKIDGETRTRFKETYDKVNNGLQAMFPILFGGGHAYLELTGDDLLETGVTVMARPPGKRNSTIHLLSGGEKALTALAFVFSIFELNPAPFCLLDEVDAPLDDANVVRLTEMLKSMARTVQFLYISHNKITMEIAEQLVGVTMQEAGVSRLVSVNMEEAVELAATA